MLAPTKIYVNALKSVKEAGIKIHACSHITGGGFYENIPRMLTDSFDAVVEKSSYPIPEIFDLLKETGDIEENIMYNTFNMGIGMVLAVEEKEAQKVLDILSSIGEKAYRIGYIRDGRGELELC